MINSFFFLIANITYLNCRNIESVKKGICGEAFMVAKPQGKPDFAKGLSLPYSIAII